MLVQSVSKSKESFAGEEGKRCRGNDATGERAPASAPRIVRCCRQLLPVLIRLDQHARCKKMTEQDVS